MTAPRRYRVEFDPAAHRDLKRLSEAQRRRVILRIAELENDPRPAGCKKLRGLARVYRIRAGELRVLYRIQDEIVLVVVIAVGNRREVYR